MSGRFQFSLARIALVLFLAACSPNVPTPSTTTAIPTNTTTVLPVHASVNLGVIVQGESSQFNQWAKNRSDKAITIAKIYTSCECLEVHLSQLEIAPSQKILASFKYDGKKEPNFAGSLQIEVTFADSDGNTVGRFNVPLEVVSTND